MYTFNIPIWKMLVGPACAILTAYLSTPYVKRFAENVGAMDIPKDGRRVHNHPIPRMGGLAIFLGFLVSVLLFVDMDMQVMGLLLGSVIIIVMGALDDILQLNPWIKLLGQILAALIAIRCKIVFDGISNPVFTSGNQTIAIGWLAYPLTVLWIVACTNAVNLIDGLDGLAVGVSAISSLSMMLVSIIVPVGSVPLLLACLCGACIGFMPYNFNPAKIFMGDVGSQFLGYVLAVVSTMGLFKFHAVITLLVPFLSMAVPLSDTFFAFFRRILRGQSPFHADRGHIHHKLLDTGMDQKQAVSLLYGISAVLGLAAVLIAGPGTAMRIVCLIAAFIICILVSYMIFRSKSKLHVPQEPHGEASCEVTAGAPAQGGNPVTEAGVQHQETAK